MNPDTVSKAFVLVALTVVACALNGTFNTSHGSINGMEPDTLNKLCWATHYGMIAILIVAIFYFGIASFIGYPLKLQNVSGNYLMSWAVVIGGIGYMARLLVDERL